MTDDTIELKRIADALERIATHLEGEVLVHIDVPKATATVETIGSKVSDIATPANYEKAVAALKAMPDDIPAPAPKGKPATKEDVVKALNTFSRVHGVAAAKGVLTQFGATLGDVPEEKYGELVALLAVTS